MDNKSIFGLNENIAAALSYVFGPFSGIVVLIMERGNKFVRFHALQSTLWFLMLMVVGWVLRFITGLPFVGWLLGIVIGPVLFFGGLFAFASLIFLAYRAYKGAAFKIPVIGVAVWSQIYK